MPYPGLIDTDPTTRPPGPLGPPRMSGVREVFVGVFGRHAAAYRERLEDAMARGEAAGRARVLELLTVRAGERVLDLGCGPGTLTAPLAAAAGPEGLTLGVDLTQGMLVLARAAAPLWARLSSEAAAGSALREAGFRQVVVSTVPEVSRYWDPEDLVDRAFTWWILAW